jgi:GNAT superfamily N-acetyltransferase
MVSLRPATIDDVPLIRELVRELAEYEREPESAVATEEDLRRDGFGPSPYFHAVIAEDDGMPVGFALYFFNYSTWQGRPGLYLEDLFVRPAHRGKGIGTALLRHLAGIARERSCSRMVWQVLDWNTPSIRFYEGLGGELKREWLTVRLDGAPLDRLSLGGESQGGTPAT